MNLTVLGPDGRPASLNFASKENRGNPTRNISPVIVERSLSAFARGDIAPFAEIALWVLEHDSITLSVSAKAETAVTQHGWEIEIQDDIPDDQVELANEQKDFLTRFYENLEARDASELDFEGDVTSLLEQMLLAYSLRYNVHHLEWDTSRGPEELGLTTHHIPLHNFTSKSGRLAFMAEPGSFSAGSSSCVSRCGSHTSFLTGSSSDIYNLTDIAPESGWMVTIGRGVMLAGLIAWIFKRIPIGDWVTYCGRNGMPGFLAKTSGGIRNAGMGQCRRSSAKVTRRVCGGRFTGRYTGSVGLGRKWFDSIPAPG